MKRIALLGMPNTGKSTFFNRMTGASARVGNWPGITVDLMGAKILLGGSIAELIDLPGIYDFHGFSEDEMVVRHFLENNAVDLVLIILNTAQIERQLSLALQIKALGLPAMLLLNMSDEAKHLGVHVDTDAMSQQLHMPVMLISAKYGEGCSDVLKVAGAQIQHSQPAGLEALRQKLISDDQLESEMARVLATTVDIPLVLPDQITEKIDRVVLHPWLGLPIFLVVMYLLFQLIFVLGKPLQDAVAWLLGFIKGGFVAPLLSHAPPWLSGLLLDGVYNGVGTVAAFVPVIILFFLVMAIVEDSGYLSRAAFLMDRLMAKLGMDGRGFVMLLMGFGCNVPALMGTRIMRSRNLRLLTMLTIPFSLCSARLQVFIFFTVALFSPLAAPIVLFSLYIMSFVTAFLTALVFKKHLPSSEPFILELPPYRLPTWRHIYLRSWQEVSHFLQRASKFIVIGVILVWGLTHIPFDVPAASQQTVAGTIGGTLAPILRPIGIDAQMTVALIFGFVAKEIVIGSLAVIYGMDGTALAGLIAHQIDWAQAMSFMLFTLIYTPCLSTIATLRNESKSNAFMMLSIGWSLGLAWGICLVFYQTARMLGF